MEPSPTEAQSNQEYTDDIIVQLECENEISLGDLSRIYLEEAQMNEAYLDTIDCPFCSERHGLSNEVLNAIEGYIQANLVEADEEAEEYKEEVEAEEKEAKNYDLPFQQSKNFRINSQNQNHEKIEEGLEEEVHDGNPMDEPEGEKEENDMREEGPRDDEGEPEDMLEKGEVEEFKGEMRPENQEMGSGQRENGKTKDDALDFKEILNEFYQFLSEKTQDLGNLKAFTLECKEKAKELERECTGISENGIKVIERNTEELKKMIEEKSKGKAERIQEATRECQNRISGLVGMAENKEREVEKQKELISETQKLIQEASLDNLPQFFLEHQSAFEEIERSTLAVNNQEKLEEELSQVVEEVVSFERNKVNALVRTMESNKEVVGDLIKELFGKNGGNEKTSSQAISKSSLSPAPEKNGSISGPLAKMQTMFKGNQSLNELSSAMTGDSRQSGIVLNGVKTQVWTRPKEMQYDRLLKSISSPSKQSDLQPRPPIDSKPPNPTATQTLKESESSGLNEKPDELLDFVRNMEKNIRDSKVAIKEKPSASSALASLSRIGKPAIEPIQRPSKEKELSMSIRTLSNYSEHKSEFLPSQNLRPKNILPSPQIRESQSSATEPRQRTYTGQLVGNGTPEPKPNKRYFHQNQHQIKGVKPKNEIPKWESPSSKILGQITRQNDPLDSLGSTLSLVRVKSGLNYSGMNQIEGLRRSRMAALERIQSNFSRVYGLLDSSFKGPSGGLSSLRQYVSSEQARSPLRNKSPQAQRGLNRTGIAGSSYIQPSFFNQRSEYRY